MLRRLLHSTPRVARRGGKRGREVQPVHGWPGFRASWERLPTEGVVPPPPGSPSARFHIRSFGGYLAMVVLLGSGVAVYLGRKERSPKEEKAVVTSKSPPSRAGAFRGILAPQSIFLAALRSAGEENGVKSSRDADAKGYLYFWHLPASCGGDEVAESVDSIAKSLSERNIPYAIAVEPWAWEEARVATNAGPLASIPEPLGLSLSRKESRGALIGVVAWAKEEDGVGEAVERGKSVAVKKRGESYGVLQPIHPLASWAIPSEAPSLTVSHTSTPTSSSPPSSTSSQEDKDTPSIQAIPFPELLGPPTLHSAGASILSLYFQPPTPPQTATPPSTVPIIASTSFVATISPTPPPGEADAEALYIPSRAQLDAIRGIERN